MDTSTIEEVKGLILGWFRGRNADVGTVLGKKSVFHLVLRWNPKQKGAFDNALDELICEGLLQDHPNGVALTQKGVDSIYNPMVTPRPVPSVQIFGGHFHQSPIGVGSTVNQTFTFEKEKDLEPLRRLVEAFETHLDELMLNAAESRKVKAQVATLKAQLEDEPDPVIMRQAGQTLRNITEGTIASLVATAAQPGVWEWMRHTMQLFFK